MRHKPTFESRSVYMKILHLEASPGWGGQEIRILREAEGLRERGHEIVLGVMKGGRLVDEARKSGFVVYELRFDKQYWPLTFFQILSLLRRHRIDLVNTHSSLDSWIGGLAARAAGCPIVRTRHLSTAIKPGWNSKLLYGKLADYVVTTCSSILPMIAGQSGKHPSHLRSIPTGVDPRAMQTSQQEAGLFRSALGILPSEFLIGTACFMRSWKGIQDFLQAAHLLRDTPRLKWVIIGGGHQETYRKMASDLKLDGIVHFTGHLSRPIAAIDALDAFALLSTAHEGVSQAILQAAFLSKPLIATPVGGLNEVCLDRQTGVLVPPGSAGKVADAALELMGDPALCKRLGQNAKMLVEAKFTLGQTLDAMEEVFARFSMDQ